MNARVLTSTGWKVVAGVAGVFVLVVLVCVGWVPDTDTPAPEPVSDELAVVHWTTINPAWVDSVETEIELGFVARFEQTDEQFDDLWEMLGDIRAGSVARDNAGWDWVEVVSGNQLRDVLRITKRLDELEERVAGLEQTVVTPIVVGDTVRVRFPGRYNPGRIVVPNQGDE